MLDAFRPVPTTLDWRNPAQVMEWANSLNLELSDAFKRLADRAADPQYIIVENETLTETLRNNEFWPGMMIAVDGTLPEVRRQADRHGFEVCDGQGDTPDMRDRFIKGASAEQGAGDTGGLSSCTCTVNFSSADDHDASVDIDDHSGHYHAIQANDEDVTASYDSELYNVYAACVGHCHGGSTSTSSDQAHSGTLAHTGSTDVVIATEPPYYEVIWVRKK